MNDKHGRTNSDDLFRSRFDNFSMEPEAENWVNIQQQMESRQMDQLLQEAFQEFEPKPTSKVWTEVKKEIPLSLWLRNHLNRLSRIAAALLLFMISLILLEHFNSHKFSTIASLPYEELDTTNDKVPILELPAEADFVLDIPANTASPKIQARQKRKTADTKEEDLESLWALILEEDEDLAEALDQDRIEEALKPLELIPIEGLALLLPSNKMEAHSAKSDEAEIDLQIMIPLKVVEDSEVEKLLHLYEQQSQVDQQR